MKMNQKIFCGSVDPEVVSFVFASPQTGKLWGVKMTWASWGFITYLCRWMFSLRFFGGYLFLFSVWLHHSQMTFSCCHGEFLNHVCWIPLKMTSITIMLCSYWPFLEGQAFQHLCMTCHRTEPTSHGGGTMSCRRSSLSQVISYATDCIFSKTLFDLKQVSFYEICGADLMVLSTTQSHSSGFKMLVFVLLMINMLIPDVVDYCSVFWKPRSRGVNLQWCCHRVFMGTIVL